VAGFPHVPWALHPRLLLHQGANEDDRAFQDRVRAQNRDGERPMIGVMGVNRKGVEHLATAVQKRRLDRSVFVHGPPGTGKTLLLCAIARTLMDANVELRRFYLDKEGRRTTEAPPFDFDRSRPTRLVRQSPLECAYKRLDSLMEEQSNKFKGRVTPVRNMGAFPGVLFFDELGINAASSGIEVDTANHVLGKRVDSALPTVVSSNLSPGDFAERYGPRVGSRLQTFTLVRMTGPDWRM